MSIYLKYFLSGFVGCSVGEWSFDLIGFCVLEWYFGEGESYFLRGSEDGGKSICCKMAVLFL